MNLRKKEQLSVSAPVAFQMLGIPNSTGYKLIENGTIPAVRLSPRKTIIPMAALEKIVNDQQ